MSFEYRVRVITLVYCIQTALTIQYITHVCVHTYTHAHTIYIYSFIFKVKPLLILINLVFFEPNSCILL